MTDASTRSDRDRAPIPVRRMDFDFDPAKVPADWFAGDTFLTTFNSGLSLVFPEGERFFVESVRHFRDRIDDPTLRKQVQGFAGQEAMHGKEHDAFNAILEARGLDVAKQLERETLWLLNLGRRIMSKREQLAVTCALEHFTAIMAEQLLGDEQYQQSIHPTVRPLWLWHAFEESEHKSVAYDVYQRVGGNYFERMYIMVIVTVFFVGMMTRIHTKLLAAQGELWNLRGWARGLWHQWGRPGALRQLVPGYLRYFRPGFHPAQAEATERLPEWREWLFGDAGVVQPTGAAA